MNKVINFNDAQFIDLTHTLTQDIPQWDIGCGFQANIRKDYQEWKSDIKFRVHQFTMSAGIGTHMDSPSHCIPGTRTIDKIELRQLIAPCFVINVSTKMHERYCVSKEDILDFENQYQKITKNSIVIVYTSWDKNWNNPEKYRNNHIFPSVSEAAAELLLEREVNGLGIDTLSPDTIESTFPVHRLLLGADKFIIENVANAGQLPSVGAYVIALPIKVKDGTETPIRLIAIVN